MSSSHSSPTSPFAPTSTSTLPSSSYATVSLHKSDTIRFLNFPASLATVLEPVIVAAWPPGLDSSSPPAGGLSFEYKCKDRPFGYFGTQQHVGGIRLMRDVLAVLYRHGWELVTSVLCSKRYTSKDTLFFRSRSRAGGVAGTVPAVEWLVLAPMRTDKLRLVYDADGEDSQHDHDHLGLLVAGVKKTLQEMGCFAKGDWSHDSFEFELKGKPWRSRGEAAGNAVRIMMMRLLELIEGHGWRLYGTFVQRTGQDEDRILDTWYFVREKGNKGPAVEMEASVSS
ncbi:hypothetical protein F5144DRAFT_173647 [Chaetomium tenue]|uniref:Uncharacterized protein n=1 Tax=Chaetomium tenue TaxID=1854479 RepID=A0ACB7PBR3_9PEZI|nr:hypothetical protein F5144DRAFT_173647 [Chaetomium globosum]